MLRLQKLKLRVSASILVLAFLAQDISYAAPIAQGITPAPLSLAQNPSTFEVPLEFAAMSEFHKGTKDVLIIHVQDAHTNLSGQENLANAMDQMMSKYKVSLVLSEGGAGDCSLTNIKKIASPEIIKRVAKSYLIQGKLSGEEYLNLVSDHPMKIMGIEDMALYAKSVQSYADLADKREATLRYLAEIRRSLDKLKSRIYPRALLNYEKCRSTATGADDFQAHFKELVQCITQTSLDLKPFPAVEALVRLEEKEAKIDFDAANLENAALIEEIHRRGGGADLTQMLEQYHRMKDQRISLFAFFQNTLNMAKTKHIDTGKYPNVLLYADTLADFAKLDPEKVLREMEKVEDRVYVTMLKGSEDARRVRAIDRYMGLLQTAYEIKMTTREFNLFKTNEPDFATVSCLAFLNQKLGENGCFDSLITYQSLLDESKKSLDAFYESVSQRDDAFIKNIEKNLESGGQKAAFVITGGYHTAHLKALIQEKGYSYVVLTPIVDAETNQAKYEKLLLAPIKGDLKTVETVSGGPRRSQNVTSELDKEYSKFRKKNEGVRAVLMMAWGQTPYRSDLRALQKIREYNYTAFKMFVRTIAGLVTNDEDEVKKIVARAIRETMRGGARHQSLAGNAIAGAPRGARMSRDPDYLAKLKAEIARRRTRIKDEPKSADKRVSTNRGSETAGKGGETEDEPETTATGGKIEGDEPVIAVKGEKDDGELKVTVKAAKKKGEESVTGKGLGADLVLRDAIKGPIIHSTEVMAGSVKRGIPPVSWFEPLLVNIQRILARPLGERKALVARLDQEHLDILLVHLFLRGPAHVNQATDMTGREIARELGVDLPALLYQFQRATDSARLQFKEAVIEAKRISPGKFHPASAERWPSIPGILDYRKFPNIQGTNYLRIPGVLSSSVFFIEADGTKLWHEWLDIAALLKSGKWREGLGDKERLLASGPVQGARMAGEPKKKSAVAFTLVASTASAVPAAKPVNFKFVANGGYTINDGRNRLREAVRQGRVLTYGLHQISTEAPLAETYGVVARLAGSTNENVAVYSYRQVYEAVEDFLQADTYNNFSAILEKALGRKVALSEINGDVYIVMSQGGWKEFIYQMVVQVNGHDKPLLVTLHAPADSFVNKGFTGEKSLLEEDFENQTHLRKIKPDHIAEPYCKGQGRTSGGISMTIYANEWMDGFLGARMHRDENQDRFILVSTQKGKPYLIRVTEPSEMRRMAFEIYKMFAIYNELKFGLISIGAGDIVVRNDARGVAVGLTTAQEKWDTARVFYSDETGVFTDGAESLLNGLFGFLADDDPESSYVLGRIPPNGIRTPDELDALKVRIADFDTIIEAFAEGVLERVTRDKAQADVLASMPQKIREILTDYRDGLPATTDEYIRKHSAEISAAIDRFLARGARAPSNDGARMSDKPLNLAEVRERMKAAGNAPVVVTILGEKGVSRFWSAGIKSVDGLTSSTFRITYKDRSEIYCSDTGLEFFENILDISVPWTAEQVRTQVVKAQTDGRPLFVHYVDVFDRGIQHQRFDQATGVEEIAGVIQIHQADGSQISFPMSQEPILDAVIAPKPLNFEDFLRKADGLREEGERVILSVFDFGLGRIRHVVLPQIAVLSGSANGTIRVMTSDTEGIFYEDGVNPIVWVTEEDAVLTSEMTDAADDPPMLLPKVVLGGKGNGLSEMGSLFTGAGHSPAAEGETALKAGESIRVDLKHPVLFRFGDTFIIVCRSPDPKFPRAYRIYRVDPRTLIPIERLKRSETIGPPGGAPLVLIQSMSSGQFMFTNINPNRIYGDQPYKILRSRALPGRSAMDALQELEAHGVIVTGLVFVGDKIELTHGMAPPKDEKQLAQIRRPGLAQVLSQSSGLVLMFVNESVVIVQGNDPVDGNWLSLYKNSEGNEKPGMIRPDLPIRRVDVDKETNELTVTVDGPGGKPRRLDYNIDDPSKPVPINGEILFDRNTPEFELLLAAFLMDQGFRMLATDIAKSDRPFFWNRELAQRVSRALDARTEDDIVTWVNQTAVRMARDRDKNMAVVLRGVAAPENMPGKREAYETARAEIIPTLSKVREQYEQIKKLSPAARFFIYLMVSARKDLRSGDPELRTAKSVAAAYLVDAKLRDGLKLTPAMVRAYLAFRGRPSDAAQLKQYRAIRDRLIRHLVQEGILNELCRHTIINPALLSLHAQDAELRVTMAEPRVAIRRRPEGARVAGLRHWLQAAGISLVALLGNDSPLLTRSQTEPWFYGQQKEVAPIIERIRSLKEKIEARQIDTPGVLAEVRAILEIVYARRDRNSGPFVLHPNNRYGATAELTNAVLEWPILWYGTTRPKDRWGELSLAMSDVKEKFPSELHAYLPAILDLLQDIRSRLTESEKTRNLSNLDLAIAHLRKMIGGARVAETATATPNFGAATDFEWLDTGNGQDRVTVSVKPPRQGIQPTLIRPVQGGGYQFDFAGGVNIQVIPQGVFLEEEGKDPIELLPSAKRFKDSMAVIRMTGPGFRLNKKIVRAILSEKGRPTQYEEHLRAIFSNPLVGHEILKKGRPDYDLAWDWIWMAYGAYQDGWLTAGAGEHAPFDPRNVEVRGNLPGSEQIRTDLAGALNAMLSYARAHDRYTGAEFIAKVIIEPLQGSASDSAVVISRNAIPGGIGDFLFIRFRPNPRALNLHDRSFLILMILDALRFVDPDGRRRWHDIPSPLSTYEHRDLVKLAVEMSSASPAQAFGDTVAVTMAAAIQSGDLEAMAATLRSATQRYKEGPAKDPVKLAEIKGIFAEGVKSLMEQAIQSGKRSRMDEVMAFANRWFQEGSSALEGVKRMYDRAVNPAPAARRDYYEVLGVAKGASPDDMKRSYKPLALKYHPDRNPGDKKAEAAFKEAAQAYEVLSDPETRAAYDQFGFSGPEKVIAERKISAQIASVINELRSGLATLRPNLSYQDLPIFQVLIQIGQRYPEQTVSQLRSIEGPFDLRAAAAEAISQIQAGSGARVAAQDFVFNLPAGRQVTKGGLTVLVETIESPWVSFLVTDPSGVQERIYLAGTASVSMRNGAKITLLDVDSRNQWSKFKISVPVGARMSDTRSQAERYRMAIWAILMVTIGVAIVSRWLQNHKFEWEAPGGNTDNNTQQFENVKAKKGARVAALDKVVAALNAAISDANTDEHSARAVPDDEHEPFFEINAHPDHVEFALMGWGDVPDSYKETDGFRELYEGALKNAFKDFKLIAFTGRPDVFLEDNLAALLKGLRDRIIEEEHKIASLRRSRPANRPLSLTEVQELIRAAGDKPVVMTVRGSNQISRVGLIWLVEAYEGPGGSIAVTDSDAITIFYYDQDNPILDISVPLTAEQVKALVSGSGDRSVFIHYLNVTTNEMDHARFYRITDVRKSQGTIWVDTEDGQSRPFSTTKHPILDVVVAPPALRFEDFFRQTSDLLAAGKQLVVSFFNYSSGRVEQVRLMEPVTFGRRVDGAIGIRRDKDDSTITYQKDINPIVGVRGEEPIAAVELVGEAGREAAVKGATTLRHGENIVVDLKHPVLYRFGDTYIMISKINPESERAIAFRVSRVDPETLATIEVLVESSTEPTQIGPTAGPAVLISPMSSPLAGRAQLFQIGNMSRFDEHSYKILDQPRNLIGRDVLIVAGHSLTQAIAKLLLMPDPVETTHGVIHQRDEAIENFLDKEEKKLVYIMALANNDLKAGEDGMTNAVLTAREYWVDKWDEPLEAGVLNRELVRSYLELKGSSNERFDVVLRLLIGWFSRVRAAEFGQDKRGAINAAKDRLEGKSARLHEIVGARVAGLTKAQVIEQVYELISDDRSAEEISINLDGELMEVAVGLRTRKQVIDRVAGLLNKKDRYRIGFTSDGHTGNVAMIGIRKLSRADQLLAPFLVVAHGLARPFLDAWAHLKAFIVRVLNRTIDEVFTFKGASQVVHKVVDKYLTKEGRRNVSVVAVVVQDPVRWWKRTFIVPSTPSYHHLLLKDGDRVTVHYRQELAPLARGARLTTAIINRLLRKPLPGAVGQRHYPDGLQAAYSIGVSEGVYKSGQWVDGFTITMGIRWGESGTNDDLNVAAELLAGLLRSEHGQTVEIIPAAAVLGVDLPGGPLDMTDSVTLNVTAKPEAAARMSTAPESPRRVPGAVTIRSNGVPDKPVLRRIFNRLFRVLVRRAGPPNFFFTGTYSREMDDKWRIILPSEWKNHLKIGEESLMLVPLFDNVILILPKKIFPELHTKGSLALSDHMLRVLLSIGPLVPLGDGRRVAIPDGVRGFLQGVKAPSQVTLIGRGAFIVAQFNEESKASAEGGGAVGARMAVKGTIQQLHTPSEHGALEDQVHWFPLVIGAKAGRSIELKAGDDTITIDQPSGQEAAIASFIRGHQGWRVDFTIQFTNDKEPMAELMRRFLLYLFTEGRYDYIAAVSSAQFGPLWWPPMSPGAAEALTQGARVAGALRIALSRSRTMRPIEIVSKLNNFISAHRGLRFYLVDEAEGSRKRGPEARVEINSRATGALKKLIETAGELLIIDIEGASGSDVDGQAASAARSMGTPFGSVAMMAQDLFADASLAIPEEGDEQVIEKIVLKRVKALAILARIGDVDSLRTVIEATRDKNPAVSESAGAAYRAIQARIGARVASSRTAPKLFPIQFLSRLVRNTDVPLSFTALPGDRSYIDPWQVDLTARVAPGDKLRGLAELQGASEAFRRHYPAYVPDETFGGSRYRDGISVSEVGPKTDGTAGTEIAITMRLMLPVAARMAVAPYVKDRTVDRTARHIAEIYTFGSLGALEPHRDEQGRKYYVFIDRHNPDHISDAVIEAAARAVKSEGMWTTEKKEFVCKEVRKHFVISGHEFRYYPRVHTPFSWMSSQWELALEKIDTGFDETKRLAALELLSAASVVTAISVGHPFVAIVVGVLGAIISVVYHESTQYDEDSLWGGPIDPKSWPARITAGLWMIPMPWWVFNAARLATRTEPRSEKLNSVTGARVAEEWIAKVDAISAGLKLSRQVDKDVKPRIEKAFSEVNYSLQADHLFESAQVLRSIVRREGQIPQIFQTKILALANNMEKETVPEGLMGLVQTLTQDKRYSPERISQMDAYIVGTYRVHFDDMLAWAARELKVTQGVTAWAIPNRILQLDEIILLAVGQDKLPDLIKDLFIQEGSVLRQLNRVGKFPPAEQIVRFIHHFARKAAVALPVSDLASELSAPDLLKSRKGDIATALRAMDAQATTDALIVLLSDEKLRHGALEALYMLGEKAHTATDAVIEVLKSDRAEKQMAVLTLGQINPKDEKVKVALTAALKDEREGSAVRVLINSILKPGARLAAAPVQKLIGDQNKVLRAVEKRLRGQVDIDKVSGELIQSADKLQTALVKLKKLERSSPSLWAHWVKVRTDHIRLSIQAAGLETGRSRLLDRSLTDWKAMFVLLDEQSLIDRETLSVDMVWQSGFELIEALSQNGRKDEAIEILKTLETKRGNKEFPQHQAGFQKIADRVSRLERLKRKLGVAEISTGPALIRKNAEAERQAGEIKATTELIRLFIKDASEALKQRQEEKARTALDAADQSIPGLERSIEFLIKVPSIELPDNSTATVDNALFALIELARYHADLSAESDHDAFLNKHLPVLIRILYHANGLVKSRPVIYSMVLGLINRELKLHGSQTEYSSQLIRIGEDFIKDDLKDEKEPGYISKEIKDEFNLRKTLPKFEPKVAEAPALVKPSAAAAVTPVVEPRQTEVRKLPLAVAPVRPALKKRAFSVVEIKWPETAADHLRTVLRDFFEEYDGVEVVLNGTKVGPRFDDFETLVNNARRERQGKVSVEVTSFNLRIAGVVKEGIVSALTNKFVVLPHSTAQRREKVPQTAVFGTGARLSEKSSTVEESDRFLMIFDIPRMENGFVSPADIAEMIEPGQRVAFKAVVGYVAGGLREVTILPINKGRNKKNTAVSIAPASDNSHEAVISFYALNPDGETVNKQDIIGTIRVTENTLKAARTYYAHITNLPANRAQVKKTAAALNEVTKGAKEVLLAFGEYMRLERAAQRMREKIDQGLIAVNTVSRRVQFVNLDLLMAGTDKNDPAWQAKRRRIFDKYKELADRPFGRSGPNAYYFFSEDKKQADLFNTLNVDPDSFNDRDLYAFTIDPRRSAQARIDFMNSLRRSGVSEEKIRIITPKFTVVPVETFQAAHEYNLVPVMTLDETADILTRLDLNRAKIDDRVSDYLHNATGVDRNQITVSNLQLLQNFSFDLRYNLVYSLFMVRAVKVNYEYDLEVEDMILQAVGAAA